jgi:3-oxoadipate enol-lactonase
MPYVGISTGIDIHYLDENPAGHASIILFHGLGANCTSWQLQIPALTQAGFRVLAPDTPGFGKSTAPRGDTNIAATTARMAEFIHALKLKSYTAVGISMGGTLALQLALDFPQETNKLVLVNTFAKLQVENLRILPYFFLRMILVHTLGLPTQARAVAKRVFPNPNQEMLRQELINQIVQADIKTYRASMRALGHFDVRDRLHEIKCPTLVVTGDKDSTVPIPNQISLAKAISTAQHIRIPQAGHAAPVEQPDQFNHILLEFLQD